MITITSPIPILLFFAVLFAFTVFCINKDMEGFTLKYMFNYIKSKFFQKK
jgi:hypothetical protein